MSVKPVRVAQAAASIAMVAASVLSAGASANVYPASDADLVASNGDDERAYKGPRVYVQGQSPNSDSFQCARQKTEYANNMVAVADDLQTTKLSFTSTSTLSLLGYGNYVAVITWNWSDTTAHIRVVTSCTEDVDRYPGASTYGDYYRSWLASLTAGTPNYVCLAREAFRWSTCGLPPGRRAFAALAAPTPLAPLTPASRPGGNTYALANGTNTLAMAFRQPRGSLRPPAIYYSTRPAAARCVAQRLHVPVSNGYGYLELKLQCAGLKPGATAKLRLRPAIRRTFRLRAGDGAGRVHLDKPPGAVEPLVFLGTHPATAPCRIRSRRLRMASRTLDLRIVGHCGRVKPGTRGELAVGGLIAEDAR